MKTQFYLTLLLTLSSLNVYSQNDYWEYKPGLPGGLVSDLVRASSTGTLYASVGSTTMYKSEDDGESWALIASEEVSPYDFLSVTASISGVLYAQKFAQGNNMDVYRSTDKGYTWQLVANNTPNRDWEEDTNGNIFAMNFISISDMSVVKSTDGGATWSTISEANFFVLDDFGKLHVNPNSNYLISSNGGTTWDTIPGVAWTSGKALTWPDGKYLAVVNDGVVMGTFGQGPPQYVNYGQGSYYTSPFLLNDGRILLGQYNLMFISEDGGLTWQPWSYNIPTGGDFVLQHELPSGKMLSALKNSLYVSFDAGLNYEPSYTGMRNNYFRDIQKDENTQVLWGLTTDGLQKSTNDGHTWHRVGPTWQKGSFIPTVFQIDQESRLFFFVPRGGMFVSYDGGETIHDITVVQDDPDYAPALCVTKYSNGLLYFGDTGLYRFNEADTSMTLLCDPTASGLLSFPVFEHPNGTWFVKTQGLEIRKSEDQGLTWSNAMGTYLLQGIDSSGTIYGKTYGWSNTKFYKSSDLTQTWQQIILPPNFTPSTFNLSEKGQLFLAGKSGNTSTVYRSVDQGATWTNMPGLASSVNQLNFSKTLLDEDGYLYLTFNGGQNLYSLAKTSLSTSNTVHIIGNVSTSEDADCSTIDPVHPLIKTIVKAEGAFTWYTTTDTQFGDYQINPDTGSYNISAQLPLPFLWDTCAVPVDLPNYGDTVLADLSVPAIVECPFVTVEMTMPGLLRCFDSALYLNYCNYGSAPAEEAVIFLQLDTFLTIVDSGWVRYDTAVEKPACTPIGLVGGSSLWFKEIGSLGINECGQTSTVIHVDCEAELGQTHCITAYSCPDILCISQQNWSGANMDVAADCEGDSVKLSITNIGSAGSQLLDFVIIEDDVVLLQGEETYDVGETKEIKLPSNGEYFRVETAQEPGHPFPQPVAAWKVGCNGNPMPAANFINQFPSTGGYASEDTDCLPNIGAYDPNDKQGFPLGFGEHNFIEPGVEIEYLIRFQNTGTAPAHNVVLKDTLSRFLDPGSIRMGAASHPFNWTLKGENELLFYFDNINLPDSTLNEPASHGFVSFRIAQQPSLPLGTEIFNSAAIYFDFNEPVITNNTHHQLGVNFLEVVNGTHEKVKVAQAMAYPNPAKESTIVMANGATTLKVFAPDGGLVKVVTVNGDNYFMLGQDGLSDGVYFITLCDENGQTISRGKVVFL
ncbi:MAG: hypothetical protein IT258_20345 [Saprospiraceae bacterium]|nr:hypothetical protein [Saprospiraceae bacterium]